MLRLSKLTDYGLLLVTQMARVPDASASFSARDLATQSNIPLPTVGKLLKRLSASHVLQSQRGAQGGYRLSRPAHEITVAEVIRSIEGPIGMTECSATETKSGCELESACPLKSNWRKVSSVILKALQGLTVADMAGRLPAEFSS